MNFVIKKEVYLNIICNFADKNNNFYSYARNKQILWNYCQPLLARPQSPHIHFTYGEYECSISVLDRVVDGKAPSKVIAKVNEWMDLHETEILTLWEKAQRGEKLGRIEPLK